MGEESILLFSSQQHRSEARGDTDYRSVKEDEDQTTETLPIPNAHDNQDLKEYSSISDTAENKIDQEPESEFSEETIEDGSSRIELFKDDCLIPSPVLKGISKELYFGMDLTEALQFIGTKYNGLLKKYQQQRTELEALQSQSETQINKCECGPEYETLKQKYNQEYSERKRLYNELIELRGNIRVFCRCRPLSAEEISKGCTSVFEFDPSKDSEFQIISSDSSKKNFKLDHVFGPEDNQEAVFAEVQRMVNTVLDGYNVCIFAYGQTGTGKTFTMEGTPDDRGVNYRTLEELFKLSNERHGMMRDEFSVSMLEVYNEKIKDLFVENSDQPPKKLEIKQAADGTQDVPGLVEAQACSIDEVWEMLKTGGRNRSVGSTNANELSSRSHCLVRVTIKVENLVNGQKSRSHLWLVDLAGSERVGKTEVEGERLKESQFINKSLSALGDVIAALATKNPHIPYRNSKLTHLLQSSLGGDCKTLMFAQISPSSADLGETLCSLNFASRVRGIENGPVRKQSDPVESFKIKQLMEKLRQEEKESTKLNESLQLMHLKYASRENTLKLFQEKSRDSELACRNYQHKIKELENQLFESRDSAKYPKPPLAPTKSRMALGTITNRLPPSGPRTSTLQNKENVTMSRKDLSTGHQFIPKARRISIGRNIQVQQNRRASVATLPNKMERLTPVNERKRLSFCSEASQLSQRREPRRRSVATFMSSIEKTMAPSDFKSRLINPSNSSKYSSPSRFQSWWKSKEALSSFASPRQRLPVVTSPGSSIRLNGGQPERKLCFPVQRRLIVGSPAQPIGSRLSIFSQVALRDKENVGRGGRVGTAQRVLCKNRRKSVI